MRVNGLWFLCDDQVLRPIFRARVPAADGELVTISFLVDSGADRTVFSAEALGKIGIATRQAKENLSGVGGGVETLEFDSKIQFTRSDDGAFTIVGRFAAFSDPETLDMSVLGRDIINLFALIVDRPQDIVCLLGQGHQYEVREGD